MDRGRAILEMGSEMGSESSMQKRLTCEAFLHMGSLEKVELVSLSRVASATRPARQGVHGHSIELV